MPLDLKAIFDYRNMLLTRKHHGTASISTGRSPITLVIPPTRTASSTTGIATLGISRTRSEYALAHLRYAAKVPGSTSAP